MLEGSGHVTFDPQVWCIIIFHVMEIGVIVGMNERMSQKHYKRRIKQSAMDSDDLV